MTASGLHDTVGQHSVRHFDERGDVRALYVVVVRAPAVLDASLVDAGYDVSQEFLKVLFLPGDAALIVAAAEASDIGGQ